MEKIVVLIPARYESQRFMGKPMAKIGNKSMIQHVYENCIRLPDKFIVAVVTDSKIIEKEILKINGTVFRVDDLVNSGTERIQLALKRYINFDVSLVVNVQGDEPLIQPEDILELTKFHKDSKFDIATFYNERFDFEGFSNKNEVKIVMTDEGRCLYFSRASIPGSKNKSNDICWNHHIGIYSYKVKALEKFCNSKSSTLEEMESLEQLRALEIGLIIGAKKTDKKFIGVDTKEDLIKVRNIYEK